MVEEREGAATATMSDPIHVAATWHQISCFRLRAERNESTTGGKEPSLLTLPRVAL
jgi:hypothetical protein